MSASVREIEHGANLQFMRARKAAQERRTPEAPITVLIIVVIIVPASAVIDLLHPVVVSAAESFAVFVPCPAGNGVGIAILLSVVYVGPAMVPEVAFRTFHTIVEAALLPSLFGFVLPVPKRRRAIVLLRERVLFANK